MSCSPSQSRRTITLNHTYCLVDAIVLCTLSECRFPTASPLVLPTSNLALSSKRHLVGVLPTSDRFSAMSCLPS